MQRQSLGSPLSKLHLLASDSLDQKHLNIPTTLPSLASDSDGEINKRAAEADELKKMIGVKNKKNVVNIESYIHIIPVLTLLCFLILYMSSHDPAHTDMAHFAGITQTLSDPADAQEDNFTGLQSIVKIKKSDILAIRSLKNLKHRKFAHF